MNTPAKPGQEGRVPFFRSVQVKYALTYILVVAAILLVMNTYPLLMAENGSAGSSGKKTIWSLRWKQGAMGWH